VTKNGSEVDEEEDVAGKRERDDPKQIKLVRVRERRSG